MELFDCETGEKISGTYVSVETCDFTLYLGWNTYITRVREAFKEGFSDSDADLVYPVALFAKKSKNCPLEKLRKKQPALVCAGILKSSTSIKMGYIPERLLKSKFKKTFEMFGNINRLEGKFSA